MRVIPCNLKRQNFASVFKDLGGCGGDEALDIAAALDLVLTAGDAGNGFRVGKVFFGEDAGSEGVGVVGVENGDGTLQDDCAVVEVLVDEVDGAAGDFHPVVEGLLLGVESGECGQERGMDIQDSVGEGGDKAGREQAHVTGEDDEVDVVFAKAGDQIGVVVGAGAAFGDVEGYREVEIFCCGKAWGIGDVRNYYRDFDVIELTGADSIGDGEEVGSAAGEEYANAKRRL